MRVIVAAAMVSAAGGLPAAADTTALVSQTFSRFETRCATAISTPQAYVNSVPNPDQTGTKTISISPDGNVIRSWFTTEGLTEDVIFIRYPDTLMVYCAVHADGQHIDHLKAASAMMSEAGLAEYSKQLAGALQTYLHGRNDLKVVGGHTPMEFATAFGGQVHRMQQPQNHLFGFMLDAGGTQVPAGVEMEHIGLSFRTFHRIEIQQ